MAIIKSLNFDEDSLNDLESIKKREPEFNLSEFLRVKLKNYATQGQLPEESALEIEIVSIKSKITELQTNLDFLENKLKDIKLEKDNKIKEFFQKEEKEKQKELDRLKTWKNNILFLYDVSEPVAELLALDYKDYSSEMDIPSFMKARGLKLK